MSLEVYDWHSNASVSFSDEQKIRIVRTASHFADRTLPNWLTINYRSEQKWFHWVPGQIVLGAGVVLDNSMASRRRNQVVFPETFRVVITNCPQIVGWGQLGRAVPLDELCEV